MNSQTRPHVVRPSFSDTDCGAVTTDRCKPATSDGGSQKKLLTLLIASVLATGPFAANAIEAKLSGQINRALMSTDDGQNSELQNVDNTTSGTRFRFVGSEDIMPGLKAGVRFEVEYLSNPSSTVTQTDRDQNPGFNERQFNVFFQGGFGMLTLGQTDGAANGGTEVDLSGTDIVEGALALNSLGGGVQWISNGAVIAPTLNVGGVISNIDFESRFDTLRYDTPAFGPFKLAVSTGVKGDQDVTDAALWYSGNVAGGKLAAALGFSSQDRAAGVDDDIVGGSISWLAPSGFSVTLATSKEDLSATQEGKFNYVKFGHKTGKHAIGVGFGKGEDQSAVGDEAESVGVGYVYKPVKWAEIYAGAKVLSLDRASGISVEDVTVITVGSRLKF